MQENHPRHIKYCICYHAQLSHIIEVPEHKRFDLKTQLRHLKIVRCKGMSCSCLIAIELKLSGIWQSKRRMKKETC